MTNPIIPYTIPPPTELLLFQDFTRIIFFCGHEYLWDIDPTLLDTPFSFRTSYALCPVCRPKAGRRCRACTTHAFDFDGLPEALAQRGLEAAFCPCGKFGVWGAVRDYAHRAGFDCIVTRDTLVVHRKGRAVHRDLRGPLDDSEFERRSSTSWSGRCRHYFGRTTGREYFL